MACLRNRHNEPTGVRDSHANTRTAHNITHKLPGKFSYKAQQHFNQIQFMTIEGCHLTQTARAQQTGLHNHCLRNETL